MNYTTNFNLRLPERNEQFNLDDWNNNTTSIDSAMQTNKTNISNNATNITSILNGLSTVNTSDTSSIYYKLMKLIYPVGSLYWSSKSTNPSALFGGTWVQIKDKFVLACGDTYKTTGATGGASTVTLTTSNMPSHTHSFTPSGTITMNAHSHNFTPKGTVSSSFTGTSTTTGGMSQNATGAFQNVTRGVNTVANAITTPLTPSVGDNNGAYTQGCFSIGDRIDGDTINLYTPDHVNANSSPASLRIDVSHTHDVTAKGSVSSSFIGSLSSTTSTTSTGSFTGSSGTTGTSGSGTSFSIMPPYVVKYCWERTA